MFSNAFSDDVARDFFAFVVVVAVACAVVTVPVVMVTALVRPV